MPALASEEIIGAITDAIAESGCTGHLVSPARRQPRRFIVAGSNAPTAITIYAWTLTFGGRPSLANEYRIQMTSVQSPLAHGSDGPTVLLGYDPRNRLFAGFDLERHRTFTTGSPSVQIDIEALRKAEQDGLSFHRKSNDEIAIGIRPDMLVTYAMNAVVLHRYGREANILKLLNQAVQQPIPKMQIQGLTAERRRVVTEVSRLSRDAAFRQRVIFAYGNRCAVTRLQLRLVDAAHILPVGAEGSADHVQNGIALSPTYHRAFDAGLIYMNENFEMRLNECQLHLLKNLNLAGGIENFSQPLGKIFLPPDPNQRPSTEMVRKANRFRQISAI